MTDTRKWKSHLFNLATSGSFTKIVIIADFVVGISTLSVIASDIKYFRSSVVVEITFFDFATVDSSRLAVEKQQIMSFFY